jgi:hypothetical protein
MERYVEPFSASKHIRESQYGELDAYLLGAAQGATAARDAYFKPDHSSLSAYAKSLLAYRTDLRTIIGYPPPHVPTGAAVREEFVAEDDLCTIRRLHLPVAEGLESYGIYLLPRRRPERSPLMLCLHGGAGCPELICGFDGSQNYHDAARRLVGEGYAVFAPLFSFRAAVDERTAIPDDVRTRLDVRAKWIGSSLAAIELFKLKRALDHLLDRPEIDPDAAGVTGVSYGGFYALFFAALDERIRYCLSSCYLGERVDVNRRFPGELLDWTWNGMIARFADAEVISLICPRPCILESGTNDDMFPIEGARREYQRARRHYGALGVAENLVFIELEGTHEFDGVEAFRRLRRFREGTPTRPASRRRGGVRGGERASRPPSDGSTPAAGREAPR